MGQRIKAQELREMLNVAPKLRASAQTANDASYTILFTRAAAALEDRAQQLAFYASDYEAPSMAAENRSISRNIAASISAAEFSGPF